MSIKRAPRPETRFYILDKDISEDMRLSWEARGLLIYLLGKPDNWVVSIKHLMKQTVPCARKRSGRDSIRAIIGELVELGYMEVTQRRSEGNFDGVDYIVRETPSSPAVLEDSPETDNPAAVTPPETDLPAPVAAAPEEAATADPHLISNNIQQGLNQARNDSYQESEGGALPSVLSKEKQAKQDQNAVLGELPFWVPAEAWISFVEMRKAMGQRGKLTANAAKLIINKLEELKNQGQDPRLVLEQSVMNNWKGVFPVKQQFAGRQQALEDRNRAAVNQFVSGSDW